MEDSNKFSIYIMSANSPNNCIRKTNKNCIMATDHNMVSAKCNDKFAQ